MEGSRHAVVTCFKSFKHRIAWSSVDCSVSLRPVQQCLSRRFYLYDNCTYRATLLQIFESICMFLPNYGRLWVEKFLMWRTRKVASDFWMLRLMYCHVHSWGISLKYMVYKVLCYFKPSYMSVISAVKGLSLLFRISSGEWREGKEPRAFFRQHLPLSRFRPGISRLTKYYRFRRSPLVKIYTVLWWP